ncbi:MAG: efflux RND transporter periplasmic adaptor subunit [Acidobacteria bacterium]|nr:efflux RND transporter periplasmic adaptor subunit [Acidobacteriota bacterium]
MSSRARSRIVLRVGGWTLFILLAVAATLSWILPESPARAWRYVVNASPTTVLPARIEPLHSSTVISEFPGRVATVLVAPGSKVAAGQCLALVEWDELNAELGRAQSRLRFAQARLAAAREMAKRGQREQSLREQYQRALRNKQAAADRLQAYSLADAEKTAHEAQARTAQVRALLQRDLATSAEVEQALASERGELRQLAAAREHYSRLVQEAQAAQTELRLAAMQLEAGDGDTLRAAEMDYQDAETSFRVAEQRASRQNILSERAGTVLKVMAQPGDRIVSGTPLFTVADLSSLVFEVAVTAPMAQTILPGSPVILRVPTDPPAQASATVTSVTLVPEESVRSYLVRITMPNPNPSTILVGLDGAVEFPH